MKTVAVVFTSNGKDKIVPFYNAHWAWSAGGGALWVLDNNSHIIGHFRTKIVKAVYYAD
jgi:hypothetical protein